MPKIARYKYQHQLPLYVPAVEQAVLREVEDVAKSRQLSVEATKVFIQYLMKLSLSIQQSCCEQWKKQGSFNEPVGDIRDMRQAVSSLTLEIVDKIAKAKEELANPDLQPLLLQSIEQTLQMPFVTLDHKKTILRLLTDAAIQGNDV